MLERDGQQQSALQAQQQALSNADHLAILHAIWTAETTPAREHRYKKLLMHALPPGHRQEPGHQARWLWHTLRAAELAGLDPGQALADAIAEMMDARKTRIGEHAADNALPWAVTALGPVPGHPPDRLEWQRRVSSIGAYRELSGHDHPTEPIGPEPTAGDPGKRAAWALSWVGDELRRVRLAAREAHLAGR